MLEKQIEGLTVAVNKLAAAIQEAGGLGPSGGAAKTASTTGAAAKKKTAAPKKAAAKKTVAKKKPAAKKPTTTKKQVSDLVLKLAEDQGRDAVIEILAEFDAAKVSELEPDQYDEVAEQLRLALGGDEEEEEAEDAEFEEVEEEEEEDIFD